MIGDDTGVLILHDGPLVGRLEFDDLAELGGFFRGEAGGDGGPGIGGRDDGRLCVVGNALEKILPFGSESADPLAVEFGPVGGVGVSGGFLIDDEEVGGGVVYLN